MSRLPFELLLALRYLRPKRTFVSVITLISVLGVTLGVAVLIIVISVMSGFDKQLRDKILGFNPHLSITEPGHSMADYKPLIQLISSNRLVKAAAPFVAMQVLLKTQPLQGQGEIAAPVVRGIIPDLESNISVLPTSIKDGEFSVENRGLLVGAEFAHENGISVGDRVEIASAREFKHWDANKNKEAPVLPEFEVRGIFDVGYWEYDAKFVITSLADAQDLNDLGNTVHGVFVMLHDPYQAPTVKAQLTRQLGAKYLVRTWLQDNSSMLSALVVEKNVMFYILFFIMIVAALCILSALITFVVQKTREIGMLKALGATDLQVAAIFLSQGALVGALGDILGYGLGMLALAYRNEFLHVITEPLASNYFQRQFTDFLNFLH